MPQLITVFERQGKAGAYVYYASVMLNPATGAITINAWSRGPRGGFQTYAAGFTMVEWAEINAKIYRAMADYTAAHVQE